jgi:hypothetical protein
MSIFGGADDITMSVQRGGPAASPDAPTPTVMRLLAQGVPLELLVDIALDGAAGGGSPADTGNPGYYRP